MADDVQHGESSPRTGPAASGEVASTSDSPSVEVEGLSDFPPNPAVSGAPTAEPGRESESPSVEGTGESSSVAPAGGAQPVSDSPSVEVEGLSDFPVAAPSVEAEHSSDSPPVEVEGLSPSLAPSVEVEGLADFAPAAPAAEAQPVSDLPSVEVEGLSSPPSNPHVQAEDSSASDAAGSARPRDPLNIDIEDDEITDVRSASAEGSAQKLDRSQATTNSGAAAVVASADADIESSLGSTRADATGVDGEVKTRPKIRLSEAPRRMSPPPPSADSAEAVPPMGGGQPAANAGGSTVASPPTSSLGQPPPSAAGRAALTSIPAGSSAAERPGRPSGEGIVRTPPPRVPPELDDNDRDSELPTRPRIPLTHDMALAAGRITSQDVAPYRPSEGPLRSRPGYGTGEMPEEPPPAVIVSRAHVISDAPPPANDRRHEAGTPRRSRRSHPDSEEFETLDLDDEATDEMARPGPQRRNSGESRHSLNADVRTRPGRTPPPPPGTAKRGAGSVQQQPSPQRAAPPPPPPAAPQRKQTAPIRKTAGRKRAWWEVLFSDDYIRTLPQASQSAIQKQVDFMEASLGIKRGDAVLDVGCGLGHHAHELARRGYLVVALDLALSMITRAAEEAQQRGLRINFLHKDIRDIGFEGTFDAVICVGTTFGFFDDEQNRSVLLRLSHALKPGGRLLLDVVNRDFVLASQPNLVWFEGDGCVVMEESDFNFYSSRLHVKRTMMRDDGRQSDVEYNIRLYSVHELGQLLKQCGFVIREVSGQEATRGMFFGAQSSRIVLLAERRPFTRTQSGEEGIPPHGMEP